MTSSFSLRWKKEWNIVVALWFFMRVVYSALGFIVVRNGEPEVLSPGDLYDQTVRLLQGGEFARLFINPWFRWDTVKYMNIAAYGLDTHNGSVALAPLYPWLIRLTEKLFGDYLFSALLLSSLFSLAALILLYEVMRSTRQSLIALTAFRIFPTTFFIFAGYSESLFLALFLGALLLAQQKTWILAGIIGAVATLARFQGVVITIVLFWMYLASIFELNGTPGEQVHMIWRQLSAQEGWQRVLKQARTFDWLVFLLPLLALGGYMFWLQQAGYGTINDDLRINWGVNSIDPLSGMLLTFRRLIFESTAFMDYTSLFLVTLCVALVIYGFFHLDPVYSLYNWALLALFFARDTPMHLTDSNSRYMFTLFPIFILATKIKNKYLLITLGTLSFILNLFLAMGFLDWRWIG